MSSDDEYEGGPDGLAEKLAGIDDALADQRAATLRASLEEYDLDDDDTELLGAVFTDEHGNEYLPAL
ncbi:hypothetical protein ABTN18_20460, partial [Acinetobacter baumannii]